MGSSLDFKISSSHELESKVESWALRPALQWQAGSSTPDYTLGKLLSSASPPRFTYLKNRNNFRIYFTMLM